MTATTDPMSPEFDLADRIRKARELHGWDIGRMADEINVSRSSVSGWERRKHQPHHKNLVDIAEATRVSLAWLTGTEQPTPAVDQQRLHRAQHRQAVEAAKKFSLDTGQRASVETVEGITIVEDGEVVATIRADDTVGQSAPIAQLVELRTFNPKSDGGEQAARLWLADNVNRLGDLTHR